MGRYDRARQKEKREWQLYNRNPFCEPVEFGHTIVPKIPKPSTGQWGLERAVKTLPHVPAGVEVMRFNSQQTRSKQQEILVFAGNQIV